MEENKKIAIISACLANQKARYDGKIVENKYLSILQKHFTLVVVCPEVFGGLSVPRDPCEIVFKSKQDQKEGIKLLNNSIFIDSNKDKSLQSDSYNFSVISNKGKDRTKEYVKGCQLSKNLALLHKAEYAFLKEKSPSCGVNFIYDGTFKKKLIPTHGLLVSFLPKNIKIISSDEIEKFIQENNLN